MSLTWTRLPERWHCQIQYENSNVHKIKKATNRRYRWRLLTSLSIKMPMDVWTSARALFPSEGKKKQMKEKEQEPTSIERAKLAQSVFRLPAANTENETPQRTRSEAEGSPLGFYDNSSNSTTNDSIDLNANFDARLSNNSDGAAYLFGVGVGVTAPSNCNTCTETWPECNQHQLNSWWKLNSRCDLQRVPMGWRHGGPHFVPMLVVMPWDY